MLEIERKFLVDPAKWNNVTKPEGITIKQGYIFDTEKGVLRVRIKGSQGFLTLKSANTGITRQEFEYEIPLNEAEELLETFCNSYISKTRYIINHHNHTWEIDVFHNQLAPLLLAEIELADESEHFLLPDFITEEVTHDERYYNSNLIKQKNQ